MRTTPTRINTVFAIIVVVVARPHGETAMRVAAGAIAKQLLAQMGITVRAAMTQMGAIHAEQYDWTQVYENPFFFPESCSPR